MLSFVSLFLKTVGAEKGNKKLKLHDSKKLYVTVTAQDMKPQKS
jgi:hypothetical protein